MRTAILSIALLLTVALAGCAGGGNGGGAAPTTPTTTAQGKMYDVAVWGSSDVTQSRTIRLAVFQGGQELKSGSYTADPAVKEQKVRVFDAGVGEADVQFRAYEGSNPVGTETVKPKTCASGKVTLEAHFTNDAAHLTWKCA